MTVRIAFCITDFDDGGAERHLAELVTRLPRDRFEPALVALSVAPRPPADRLRQMVSDHRIPITFLDGRNIFSTPLAWQRLRRWLVNFRPEILQCFLAHANVLGAYAGHRAGVPHIVAGIQVAELRRGWHLALQRRTARFVEKHVCVSQSVADFAVATMRLPREKLVVIGNGIELNRFLARSRLGGEGSVSVLPADSCYSPAVSIHKSVLTGLSSGCRQYSNVFQITT